MKTYLEPADIILMERAAANVRDALLIRLLFHLGCRISEVLALAVDDIDFQTSAVTIQHLKSRIKLSCPTCKAKLGARHIFCPGCGNRVAAAVADQQERRRQRVLPIDAETLDMLEEYVRRGGPIVKGGKRLVFGINRHRAWQIIKECADRAGLPALINPETGRVHGVSPHRLRDAFAVHAMKLDDSGEGMRLLQEHLGHASFNTTAKYRKVAGEEHRAWYERLWNNEQKSETS